jgi:hypothetical protein
MVHIAGAAAAEVSEAIAVAEEEVSEVVVAVFVEVVAGANGTVGRFRAEVTSRRAGRGLILGQGVVMHKVDTR